jgi:beta-lactamase superfamily II metal-dependent hydrolase
MVDDHGNSYVIRTVNDSIIVVDGGKAPETDYLRGFLGALGNRVCAWIVSHPHFDHVEALTHILWDRKGLSIGRIYQSRFTDAMLAGDPVHRHWADDYYAAIDSVTDIPIIESHAGDTFTIDGVRFRILSESNPEITENVYNNSSMAVRIEDKTKSVVLLGDLGTEGGDKLLNSKYRRYLDCDYLQVAHHGQRGCTEHFYKSIKFRACLWPTASWIWNNDWGQGPGTGPFLTAETRRWMDEIGITEHYVSIYGLQRID